MDYSLRNQWAYYAKGYTRGVLILILMDYSLSTISIMWLKLADCLNPYSNGLLSECYLCKIL